MLEIFGRCDDDGDCINNKNCMYITNRMIILIKKYKKCADLSLIFNFKHTTFVTADVSDNIT